MATSNLDLLFVAATCAVAATVVGCAWRGVAAPAVAARHAKSTKLWLLGATAFLAYTVFRDAAVAALMSRAGLDPRTFLFVDVVCLVPYLVAAPRAAQAAMEGKVQALAGWAVAFLFSAMAPVAYLALVFRQAAGTVTSLATAYLVIVFCAGAFGLLRKSGRLPFAKGGPLRTVAVRRQG